MARLGENRYGKAQIRLMKVDRDTERHVLHDLNVSISLAGDIFYERFPEDLKDQARASYQAVVNGAATEQHVREAASGGADIQGDLVGDLNGKVAQPFFQFESAATDIG